MIHENTQSLHHKINISHNHYVTSPHIASHYLTTYVDKVTVYLYSQMHISCLCIYTRISTLSAVLVYYTYLCSMVYNIYIYMQCIYIYICIYTKIQLNIWHLCINIHIYNIYIYTIWIKEDATLLPHTPWRWETSIGVATMLGPYAGFAMFCPTGGKWRQWRLHLAFT